MFSLFSQKLHLRDSKDTNNTNCTGSSFRNDLSWPMQPCPVAVEQDTSFLDSEHAKSLFCPDAAMQASAVFYTNYLFSAFWSLPERLSIERWCTVIPGRGIARNHLRPHPLHLRRWGKGGIWDRCNLRKLRSTTTRSTSAPGSERGFRACSSGCSSGNESSGCFIESLMFSFKTSIASNKSIHVHPCTSAHPCRLDIHCRIYMHVPIADLTPFLWHKLLLNMSMNMSMAWHGLLAPGLLNMNTD